MAERYLFFNSRTGDRRRYTAQDLASYFRSVLSTGLLHTDNIPTMGVTVEAGTLNTIVSAGKAIMEGHLYENTTPLTLTHAIPEVTLDRIDRVVLRLNLNNAVRDVKLHVLEGEPSNNPKPPELTRTQFVYEISLAQILVRANTVQLLPTDLTDERADESLCGLVFSLISVPTDVFANQFDVWFNSFKGEKEVGFEDWLDSIKDILDTNVAGNLLNLINANRSDIERLNKIKKDFVILKSSWVGSGEDFTYVISDLDITNNSMVDVNIHRSSLPFSNALLSVTESAAGSCTLYSTSIPKEDLVCDYVIVTEVI